MKIEIIKKDCLEETIEKLQDVSDTESMITIAEIETDDEHIYVFLDKNNGKLECLCENEEVQFYEKDVNTIEDIIDYVIDTIRKIIIE